MGRNGLGSPLGIETPVCFLGEKPIFYVGMAWEAR